MDRCVKNHHRLERALGGEIGEKERKRVVNWQEGAKEILESPGTIMEPILKQMFAAWSCQKNLRRSGQFEKLRKPKCF
jgi:hypothetical protein